MRKTSAQLVALGILTSTGSAFALEAAPAAPARPPVATEKGPSAEEAGAPGPTDAAGGDPTPKNPPSPAPTEGPQAEGGPPAPQGPTASPEAAPPLAPDGEEPEVAVTPARDTVGGHLSVGAAVGLFVPFGSVDSSLAQSEIIGPGLLLRGDITYGVSRTVMAGVYGEFAIPSGAGPWSGQNASSIAVGPMVRYHLVQGTRFDPWLAYGIGLRRLSNGNVSYTGIDWAHLELGGDWYAASNVGFGPLLELSMGTFVDSSGGALGTKAVNADFVLGARLVFDGPGK